MTAASDDKDFEVPPDRRSFVLKIVVIVAIVVAAIGMGFMVILTLLFPIAVARRQRAKLDENEKLKANLRQIGIGLHNNAQTHDQQTEAGNE